MESDDSVEVEVPPVINYPQGGRRKKSETLEAKIDLRGKYSYANMVRSNLEESKESNAVLMSEFHNKRMSNCIVNYQIKMISGI